MQLRAGVDVVMATSSYTAEFGSGVVVNGLDLNPDATRVLVGGRKGAAFVWSSLAVLSTERGMFVYYIYIATVLLMLLLLCQRHCVSK